MPTSFETFQTSKGKLQAATGVLDGGPGVVSGSPLHRIAEVRNATGIGRTLHDSRDWTHRIVAEALDVLNLAILATDSSGHVVLANRIAQQILKERDGLQLSVQGILEPSRSSARSSLLELISGASLLHLAESPSCTAQVLVVKRSSGKRPLTVVVRSVRSVTLPLDANVASALIFALDPERPMGIPEAGLRQLYGVTTSEARLSNLLMEGNTLEECCADLGIQVSTGRMHLGSLFTKTGVQRQSQLVSLLLSSVGVLRTTATASRCETFPGSMSMGEAQTGKKNCAASAAGLEALDHLGVGVAVIDETRRRRFANPVAERLLSDCEDAELSGESAQTTSGSSNPSLWELLLPQRRGDSKKAECGRAGTLVAAPRKSGKRPLTLMVRSFARFSTADTNAASIMFIVDPQHPMRVGEESLRQLYGFTPSEVRLANLLLEGKSLEACCEQLQIRSSTARMHLSNLFAKTGVQRQGPLISLLVRSLGPLPFPEVISLRQPEIEHEAETLVADLL